MKKSTKTNSYTSLFTFDAIKNISFKLVYIFRGTQYIRPATGKKALFPHKPRNFDKNQTRVNFRWKPDRRIFFVSNISFFSERIKDRFQLFYFSGRISRHSLVSPSSVTFSKINSVLKIYIPCEIYTLIKIRMCYKYLRPFEKKD